MYIYENDLNVCKVYGKIVTEDEAKGQLNLSDFGIFDLERPLMECTGYKRTGCVFCGYGAHLDKGKGRFQRLAETHPNQYDFVMRGGAFDEDGLWKPDNRGLGYWFCIKWLEVHGDIKIKTTNLDYYIEKYGTEETEFYLK